MQCASIDKEIVSWILNLGSEYYRALKVFCPMVAESGHNVFLQDILYNRQCPKAGQKNIFIPGVNPTKLNLA